MSWPENIDESGPLMGNNSHGSIFDCCQHFCSLDQQLEKYSTYQKVHFDVYLGGRMHLEAWVELQEAGILTISMQPFKCLHAPPNSSSWMERVKSPKAELIKPCCCQGEGTNYFSVCLTPAAEPCLLFCRCCECSVSSGSSTDTSLAQTNQNDTVP